MRLNIQILFVYFTLTGLLYSQYPNQVIYPSANVQIEPIIVVSPTNPQLLFASSYTRMLSNSLFSEGVYVSTNGGVSWAGTDTCTGAPLANHSGDPGPIIDKNGIFILTHLGSAPAGMFCNVSTNNGSTWSNSLLVAGNNQEKGTPGTDIIPTSPYFGRTYVAWTRGSLPFDILLSYTTNSGSGWSSFVSINSPDANHQSLGGVMTFGPGGIAFVAWAKTNTSTFLEDAIGLSVSTNGGINWSAQESAFAVNGIKTAQFQPWSVRVNGYPSIDCDITGGTRNGWLYVVSAEVNHSPAGSDADLVFHRSTNNGQTWSNGIRVNQDPLNNGRVQFLPELRVDSQGGIDVVYYDNRNTADSVELYLSRSTNGGDNWTDFKISNHKFKPRTATSFGTGIWGDHIGLVAAGNFIYPVWMDDYNSTAGLYKIWTAKIDITTIGIERIGTEVPSRFGLQQNYPNPFNPLTKIRFSVPHITGSDRNVRLVVYDALGKETAVLVNQILKAGNYETNWDASSNASGIYYYKLDWGSGSETKKMVLVK